MVPGPLVTSPVLEMAPKRRGFVVLGWGCDCPGIPGICHFTSLRAGVVKVFSPLSELPNITGVTPAVTGILLPVDLWLF